MSENLTFTDRPEKCPACGAKATGWFNSIILHGYRAYNCGAMMRLRDDRWGYTTDCPNATVAAVEARATLDRVAALLPKWGKAERDLDNLFSDEADAAYQSALGACRNDLSAALRQPEQTP